jgi:hypothetical protein
MTPPPGIIEYVAPYVASAAAWAALLFIVAYTWLAPWWKTPFGRMIVFLDVALFAALLPGVVSDDFGVMLKGTFWQWFTLTAVSMVPLVIAFRIKYLWKLQNGASKLRHARMCTWVRKVLRRW